MASGYLTYSLSLPVELTRLCASKCEFCPYPYTRRSPLPAPSKIEKAVRMAQRMGATMIEYSAGDFAGEQVEIKSACQYYSMGSFEDYLIEAARAAHDPREGRPLTARLDIGPLSHSSLSTLRDHFLSARILLTSVDSTVLARGPLANAPTQQPSKRLQSIIDAGKVGLPLTTGIMVGIGESAESRKKALTVLKRVAFEYGHLQNVLIQSFHPHPATPMADYRRTPLRTMIETVEMAREILPPSVRVQINALDWLDHLERLVEAGVQDLGDLNLRILKKDGPNLDLHLSMVFERLKAEGYTLRPRAALLPLRGYVFNIADRLKPVLKEVSHVQESASPAKISNRQQEAS